MARILVIDDEPMILEVLAKVLLRAGHDVITVTNGSHGLTAFQAEPFDLVITDLVMPEKEGLETIRDLLKISPDLRIIAISGGGAIDSEFYLSLAEKFGAKRVLQKPFSQKELLDVVNDILN